MRVVLLLVMLLAISPAVAGEMRLTQAIEAAAGSDVVVVGEVHDNPVHHAVQADFARELAPAAIVYEMIAQSREDTVNRLRREGATRAEIAAALDWESSGWPDFAHYAAIMEAAPDARIFGANVPRDAAREAIGQGAAAAFGGGAARFGLARPLAPEDQAAREAAQATAHCYALPGEMLPGMVEAQRLRDAALAAAVLRARASTAGGQVLVITGNGHAERVEGMPAALAHAEPGLEVFVFGQFEAEPVGPVAFDGWHVTAGVDRQDPCAAFARP